ncbi:MAG TPA: hypothetical protein VN665_03805 [Candidatus Paceibacterota bacterium]|nr:hypothetical protein [Candidatus Paceibacterota bacterium]
MIPTQQTAYTLTYCQPLVVSRNPVKFEWETKFHQFTARDDNEAYKMACRFLGSEPVTCESVTKRRKGKRLKQDHPYRIVREFVSASEIKALAS